VLNGSCDLSASYVEPVDSCSGSFHSN
jgi:hypothetical protein